MSDEPEADLHRRRFIFQSAGLSAALALTPALLPNPVFANPNASTKGNHIMRSFTTKDGTSIFYKDWGSGRPIVFSHGWPLTSDAWDAQMLFLGMHGYRVIAHDRRGHGRSGQTWNGNDMDTYADDVAQLFETLDLRSAVFVGHSTGGGEVTRYLGRHGTKRVSKAVLIGAVPPVMIKSDRNPEGLPKQVFDDIRQGVIGNRSQFYRDLAVPFYGYNRPNVKTSAGVIDAFWLQGMLGGIKPQYDCIKQFSETDFTEDLRTIDIPVLVLHGGDDQIVPIHDSAMKAAKLLRKSTLKIVPGGSHGMCVTQADQINQALLEFIEV
jgi:non-heme chloroperoxidase